MAKNKLTKREDNGIYGFWLLLWYLQALLSVVWYTVIHIHPFLRMYYSSDRNPVISNDWGKDRKCLQQVEHIRGY
jgi:hypothetical protein